MERVKDEITEKICYTDLVYGRICKKLTIQMTNEEIERFVIDLIKETPHEQFVKRGKNYYISNGDKGVRLTINSYTHRIITADRIKG